MKFKFHLFHYKLIISICCLLLFCLSICNIANLSRFLYSTTNSATGIMQQIWLAMTGLASTEYLPTILTVTVFSWCPSFIFSTAALLCLKQQLF